MNNVIINFNTTLYLLRFQEKIINYKSNETIKQVKFK
jgi:hypothetical protein